MFLKYYQAPRVLNEQHVELESDLLTGSVVKTNTEVKTTGQKVDTYDFSAPQFNQDWGE